MGYLDEYEQGGRRFDKIVRAAAIVLLASALLYGFYWLFFRNWAEERRVRQFLETVQAERYEEAYEFWGCSVDEPCRYYGYDKFLEDWGPGGEVGSIDTFQLGRSYTQPNGVIVEVTINGRKQPNLWVQKDTKVISFFPY